MSNNLKTWFYLLVLSALLMFVGSAFGGRQGLLIGFVLALATNFVSYFYSDKIVLRMYGARPVEGIDPYGLQDMVAKLADQIGIPKPKVYIIPTETPNAFATGRSPQHAAVAATEGILKLLTREEMEGVLAHELSHVQHRDTLIMAVAATLATVIMYLAQMARWAAIFGGMRRDDDDRGSGVLETLLLALVAPLAATVIQLAISRGREFMADDSGAHMTGNPQALASALWKIHNYAQAMPMAATPATAHMFIVNPLYGGGLLNLFSTHPPIEERIRRLTGRTP
jgi:heat shock protein HtpX